jgi:hypothetical protein
MHAAPAQHPEHCVGSHLHAGAARLVSQIWFGPHGGFVPHLHPPLVHRSLLGEPHTPQVRPVMPHWLTLFVIWQTPSWQQPPSQFPGLQPEHCPVVWSHDWPVGQFEQTTPPKPHAGPASPFSHTPPSGEQQPMQLCGSHSHWPPEHR